MTGRRSPAPSTIRPESCNPRPVRRDYDRRKDEFVDFNENSVLQLIAIVLLMALFGCAVAVLDHWVWARRPDLPPGPR
jgi:hypothetical protein